MKKRILKVLAISSFVGLVFCGSLTAVGAYASFHREQENRAYLIDFIHYCKGCEGLRQIDPTKDYTKSTNHELKNLARFYMEQDNFADVSDYWDIKVIDKIVKH